MIEKIVRRMSFPRSKGGNRFPDAFLRASEAFLKAAGALGGYTPTTMEATALGAALGCFHDHDYGVATLGLLYDNEEKAWETYFENDEYGDAPATVRFETNREILVLTYGEGYTFVRLTLEEGESEAIVEIGLLESFNSGCTGRSVAEEDLRKRTTAAEQD